MLRYYHRDSPGKPHAPIRLLVAANDMTARTITSLSKDRNYECLTPSGLDELCASWQQGPSLIFLDGLHQNCDIPDACRRIRLSYPTGTAYIVLIIPGSEKSQNYFDVPYAPDDILTSPFTQGDIEARISVGTRVLELENELSAQISELTRAASKIQTLSGLLPICSHCKKIRDDQGYWNELEQYISDHSDAEFSHAICPGCLREYYPDVNDDIG